jgi:hypothetical protein
MTQKMNMACPEFEHRLNRRGNLAITHITTGARLIVALSPSGRWCAKSAQKVVLVFKSNTSAKAARRLTRRHLRQQAADT